MLRDLGEGEFDSLWEGFAEARLLQGEHSEG